MKKTVSLFIFIFLVYPSFAADTQRDNLLEGNQKKMTWMTHFTYMAGALGGAASGSFLVHACDTIAARKFSQLKNLGFRSTGKAILKSYIPVGIGIVPMRAASFGVYSVVQAYLSKLEGFDGKLLAAMASGISLSVLSTPGEILKTRKQLDIRSSVPWYRSMSSYEIKKNFAPLAFRVVPTVTCMLAGTEYIQNSLQIENLFVSTFTASLLAATLSQIIGTPSDNIRIHRIQNKAYEISTFDLIKVLRLRLYTGFLPRALSLGIQAGFTLSAAKYASTS